MTRNKFVLLFSITCLMVSCIQKDVYLQYRTLPTNGWNKDSVLTFDIPISDTASLYNVYINIRHRGEYPYQNLWFFLRQSSPVNDSVTKDTIECYLADHRENGSARELVLFMKCRFFTFRKLVFHMPELIVTKLFRACAIRSCQVLTMWVLKLRK